MFSSIDHGGRYAYGNQPVIAQWNLARLAEALLTLIDDDTPTAVAKATAVLETFPARFQAHWLAGMRAKLGLAGADDGDATDDRLAHDALDLLQAEGVDMTSWFRALSSAVVGRPEPARRLFADPAPFDAWATRWLARMGAVDTTAVARAMDQVNPAYIPRNHLVEAALEAATAGDLQPFDRLVDAVSRPFEVRAGLEAYAEPAPASFGRYRTFCGT